MKFSFHTGHKKSSPKEKTSKNVMLDSEHVICAGLQRIGRQQLGGRGGGHVCGVARLSQQGLVVAQAADQDPRAPELLGAQASP